MFRTLNHRRLARLAAFATVVLAGAAAVAFPSEAPLPEGWRTPIIAFELARTPAELTWLAGPEAADIRSAMRWGHRVDTLFPLAYGALLVLSCRAASGRLAAAAAGLAGLAIPLDWLENAALGGITDAIEAGGDGSAGLSWLIPLTWGKWGAIGGALVLLCLAIWRDEPRTALLLAPLACSVPVAAVTGAPAAGETMALAISLSFGVLILRSLWLGVAEPVSTGPPPGAAG